MLQAIKRHSVLSTKYYLYIRIDSKYKPLMPVCKIHMTFLFSSKNKYRPTTKIPELQDFIKEMYKDFNISKTELTNMKMQSKDLKKHLYDITLENEAITSEYSPDIIYDFDEENILKKKGLWPSTIKKKQGTRNLEYQRGSTEVFDVEGIVELLRLQKAKDIVAIRIPPEFKFVDHLVIATGKSARHISIVSEFIRQVYKDKKHQDDKFLTIEGKGSDWVALDMKKIAVHILTEEVRGEKDMEMLWTVGAKFDEKCLEI